MRVTLDLTETELILIYLMTGNHQAYEILEPALKAAGRMEPKKPRKEGLYAFCVYYLGVCYHSQ